MHGEPYENAALDRARVAMLKQMWALWAHTCGIVAIAGGIAFAMVYAFAKDGAVVSRIGPVDYPTTIVKADGAVSFYLDIQKFESCPGEVVYSFKDKRSPTIVTTSRPTRPSSQKIGVKQNIHVLVDLPASVGVGEWNFTSGVNSQCATRKRYDELANFDIQVVP